MRADDVAEKRYSSTRIRSLLPRNRRFGMKKAESCSRPARLAAKFIYRGQVISSSSASAGPPMRHRAISHANRCNSRIARLFPIYVIQTAKLSRIMTVTFLGVVFAHFVMMRTRICERDYQEAFHVCSSAIFTTFGEKMHNCRIRFADLVNNDILNNRERERTRSNCGNPRIDSRADSKVDK